jgi:hypothetical protein
MTVRVEFCGVPASGKSTLCAGALRVLKKRGRMVLGREAMVKAGLRSRDLGAIGNLLGALLPGWRRKFLGLPHGLDDWHRFAVDHPAFAALIHSWLAEGQTDDTWRSAVFYALLTSAFEFQLSLAAKQPVVLDEGFAQRFFSLRGYRGLGRPEDAARYVAAMPLPSALVVVATPPEICVERVKRRPHIPVLLEGELDSILPVRFAEGAALLYALAPQLERRGIPVLRVKGDGDLEEVAARIADFAESILAREKGGL